MEKRYQVFISSTFSDLEGARREISDALLQSDCFPAGMELFPAADEEQFNFIKQIIDQSDYYIVISAGRYGSIHPEFEKSYTELEYDYALCTGKPIIRLLHKDPLRSLTGDAVEQSDLGKRRLFEFREKLSKGAMVKYWESAGQLGQLVVLGLIDAKRRRPAIGWLRADNLASDEAIIEIAQLRQRVAELELKIERSPEKVNIDNIIEQFNVNVEISLYIEYRGSAHRDVDVINLFGTEKKFFKMHIAVLF